MDRLMLETESPAELESIGVLRRMLDLVTGNCVHQQAVRQRMLLCASEAVTNLVLHGDPRPDRVTLRFGRNSLGWWLEILDDGGQWDPTGQEQGHLLAHFKTTEHGRGIALLQTQCDRMEYKPGTDTRPNRLRMSWAMERPDSRPGILVVEDDNALRRLYAAYLGDNFRVQTAADGHEALQYLQAGDIDLVLSDICMPQMNGFSLREKLNGERNSALIPFIFLTAADDAHMYHNATNLGVDDYLLKPVDKAKLTQTILRVLERSRQLHRNLNERINKRISSALAPSLPTTSHGWRLAVANRHTGVGGGDLLLHRSSDDGLMIALVDIMGHDDAAKFFAYACGGYLRGLMQSVAGDDSPLQLLEKLSENILQDELLSQVTLTCCAARLQPGGQVMVASGGHPPPIRINKQGSQVVDVGGILPGLLPATRYQAKTIQLVPGERIALCTDGLFESAADEATRKELESRIRQALLDTLGDPIDRSVKKVMRLFDELAGTPPRDDALLLLLEPAEE